MDDLRVELIKKQIEISAIQKEVIDLKTIMKLLINTIEDGAEYSGLLEIAKQKIK